MKSKGMGRALGTKQQESKRMTALTARRREQSLARFMESLQEGAEFTNHRDAWCPIG